MAYYFAVETEKEYYVGKNIKKSGYFDENYTYQEHCACTLEEIDKYTTRFNNEKSIKRCLLSENILTEEDIDKPLSIFYAQGLERRKVRGKILYKESKSFIENPNLVVEYIGQKFDENDLQFFKDLAASLPENSIIALLTTQNALLVEKRLLESIEEQNIDEEDKNIVLQKSMTLLYDFTINNDNRVIEYDPNKLNYENFHNTVSFISDYELSLNKTKTSTTVKTKKKQM